MKKLDMMILLSFLRMLFVSLLFFIFIIELVDLFSNLWRYLNNNAPVTGILEIQLLYIPKCFIFAVPPALLFSVSFTLGSLYAENELIAVFGSGISLYRFVLPLIIAGALLSVANFYFNDSVVIDTYKEKVSLTNQLLGRTQTFSNTNITVISKKNIIYDADYYNDNSTTLSGLTVIVRDSRGGITMRVDTSWAVYKEGLWEMHKARVFSFKGENVTEKYYSVYTSDEINESPDTFKRKIKDMSELKVKEARNWLNTVRKAGLPVYRESLTDYYERFSFSLTPFIVILFSASIGGRFKKNVLLMSLLTSLGISVLYYVFKMILVLFAKQGYIQPVTGAWGTFILFFITSLFLFHHART